MKQFREYFLSAMKSDSVQDAEHCDVKQLYNACGKAINAICSDLKREQTQPKKKAAYFSAEFLTGSFLENGLYNLGLTKEADEVLGSFSRRLSELEAVDDPALGNGGLGRLAACYLASAACTGIPLDGYGIRYKYGLFRQRITDSRQTEHADDWQRFTDPFGIRNEEEAVSVVFADQTLKAVPYDYHIIGTDGKCINRLRLYQAECDGEAFDFPAFRAGEPSAAFDKQLRAEAVSAVLYPDDSDDEGKVLRIKQQYFFCAAALKNIIDSIKKRGGDLRNADEYIAVQLNDTHPAVSVAEFIRLLGQEGIPFEEAFAVSERVFAYTNHTVMAEALEKWDVKLYRSILPEIVEVIEKIDGKLVTSFRKNGTKTEGMRIIEDGLLHMARLCVFCCRSVNGVAELHTNILKTDLMKQWHYISPKKFSNKTNGVDQRRWLAMANPLLTAYLKELLGTDCIENIDSLSKLKQFTDDETVLKKIESIRYENKKRLCETVFRKEGKTIEPDGIFFVQVKRIHEYKRQLMNALSIIDLCYMIKSGLVTDLPPMTFLIGGKAAASYKRAKSVISFIDRLSGLINSDPVLQGKLCLHFIENYDVSYAQRIIPAADFSEQISLVTTEASGTGNMKFMMNGAVTVGTYDGANVEIARLVGEENCLIFGLRQQEYEKEKEHYDPKALYASEPRVKRAVDVLISDEFDAEREYRGLYDSLLKSADDGQPDPYMVLREMTGLTEARLKAAHLYADRKSFLRMSLMNTACSSFFSSDRAVREYAEGIWFNEG